jgi:tripartite-type tricarboxylate transporter receptor subunit TctC
MRKFRFMGLAMAMLMAAGTAAGCGSSSTGSTTAAATTAAETKAAESSAGEKTAESAAESKAAGSVAKPDNYPKKNISVVCPYSAGGTTDLCIRGLVDAIPDGTLPSGVNILVNNVTGGGGLVGTQQFVNSASDGYTLGIVNCDLILNKVNGNTEITYDQFTPVACLMNQPNLILVNKNAEFQTFKEFVDYAKAHPGEVKVGNSGEGTIPRLCAQAVEKALGLEFKYVNYDGDTNSVTAVVSGEVDVTMCSAAPAIGQLQAGTIKAIAVSSNKRMESYPDVPAWSEECEELKDTQILTWVYLAAKKDVDTGITDYLTDIFAQANATDKFKETQKSFSIEPTTFDGVESTEEFMQKQYDMYDKLVNQ